MLLNPFRFGGGGGGGGASHRYWRIRGISLLSGDLMEFSEVQLWNDGSRVDAGATITCSSPSGGSIGSMTDNNATTRAFWIGIDANTFFHWDFGSPQEIDAVVLAGFDTSGRYPQAFTLQYSDDNSGWTTKASITGLTYPGNFTFSGQIAV